MSTLTYYLLAFVPVKRCGNLIGRMTASFSASLAPSSPATSFHFTFGFSMIMAPVWETKNQTPIALL